MATVADHGSDDVGGGDVAGGDRLGVLALSDGPHVPGGILEHDA